MSLLLTPVLDSGLNQLVVVQVAVGHVGDNPIQLCPIQAIPSEAHDSTLLEEGEAEKPTVFIEYLVTPCHYDALGVSVKTLLLARL